MTIDEAINRTDSLIPNAYQRDDKLAWLSTLDGTAKKEIFDTHHYAAEEEEREIELPYTGETPFDTELLIPAPYDDNVYVYYLEMQINYYNGEIERFNNSRVMYEQAYSDFRNYWNRTHRPKTAYNRYF